MKEIQDHNLRLIFSSHEREAIETKLRRRKIVIFAGIPLIVVAMVVAFAAPTVEAHLNYLNRYVEDGSSDVAAKITATGMVVAVIGTLVVLLSLFDFHKHRRWRAEQQEFLRKYHRDPT
jgi:hypothetical protein